MTEKQWLRSANAETMNDYYADRHTERKARLLMLACCRRHPEYLAHAAVKPVVKLLADHYADPRVPDRPFDGPKVRAAYRKLEAHASSTAGGPERGLAFGMVAAAEPVSAMKRLHEDFEYLVFSCLHDVAYGVAERNMRRESKQQSLLVREILGNPFRPVVADPAWRTDTVVALAGQIHQSEDFTLFPILADALQDAGCDDERVLAHCRGESLSGGGEPVASRVPHVRGCWLLDLLMGKA